MPTFDDMQKAAQGTVVDAEPVDFLGDVGFADAFPPPVVIQLAKGKVTTLSPWTTDDYIPWLSELTADLRKRRMASIPVTATALERWKIATNIEETEMTPDDLMGLLFRPSSSKRIIMGALAKAKVPDEEAEAYYKSRPARANEMLGILLSGLYTTAQFNDLYRRFMPVTAPPPRTFGQNGGAPDTVPFDNRGEQNGSSPLSDSSEVSGEKTIGLSADNDSAPLVAIPAA